MKLISWNVKGLGCSKKNFSIKDLRRKYKADIVMLQESKKQGSIKQCFRSFWGGRNKDCVFSPAKRSAGVMVIGWKDNLFEDQAVEAGNSHFLSICPTGILAFLDGFLASMVLPLIEGKRNVG